jgi:omega-amidase
MKVAAMQMDIVHDDQRANYEKVSRFMSDAAERRADLFVLPEMFSTGFVMSSDLVAEPLDGPTASFLRAEAKAHQMGVIGGFSLSTPSGKPRNVALAVDRNGEDVALYAKTHLFSFMNEDRHHQAGNGPSVFELEGLRAACFICYDLRFPELFRMVADRCDAIFVIASWPEPRQLHWDILLKARAVENQLYVIGVNRVGQGGDLSFTGGSVVIGPDGRFVAAAGEKESLLVADIDPDKVGQTRAALPFLKDRRF